MSDNAPAPIELATAEEQSNVARKKLAGTLAEIQARLNPKALAREAIDEIRGTGQEIAQASVAAAKRHPLGVAGAAAAIGLLFARKPIVGLFARTKTETPAPGRRYSKRSTPDATKGTDA